METGEYIASPRHRTGWINALVCSSYARSSVLLLRRTYSLLDGSDPQRPSEPEGHCVHSAQSAVSNPTDPATNVICLRLLISHCKHMEAFGNPRGLHVTLARALASRGSSGWEPLGTASSEFKGTAEDVRASGLTGEKEQLARHRLGTDMTARDKLVGTSTATTLTASITTGFYGLGGDRTAQANSGKTRG
ncbi:hypothetical protein BC628DRAFT_518673 [Trametes gibbosa]|nr:hypothetical protein BC628DRAFT_518673 [Trametes gibbosa]